MATGKLEKLPDTLENSASFHASRHRDPPTACELKQSLVSKDVHPAIDAEFMDIVDMAAGPDGSLYILDGDRVRVLSPNGVISTVAGTVGGPQIAVVHHLPAAADLGNEARGGHWGAKKGSQSVAKRGETHGSSLVRIRS